MYFYKGQFILLEKSKKPGIIVNIYNDTLIISIDEYLGDYTHEQKKNVKPCNLYPCEKLSIINKFNKFFYEYHKDIYQFIIIENIMNYYKKKIL